MALVRLGEMATVAILTAAAAGCSGKPAEGHYNGQCGVEGVYQNGQPTVKVDNCPDEAATNAARNATGFQALNALSK